MASFAGSMTSNASVLEVTRPSGVSYVIWSVCLPAWKKRKYLKRFSVIEKETSFPTATGVRFLKSSGSLRPCPNVPTRLPSGCTAAASRTCPGIARSTGTNPRSLSVVFFSVTVTVTALADSPTNGGSTGFASSIFNSQPLSSAGCAATTRAHARMNWVTVGPSPEQFQHTASREQRARALTRHYHDDTCTRHVCGESDARSDAFAGGS